MSSSLVLILAFLIQLSSSCTYLDPSRCITFHNNCPFDIFPAILGRVGTNPPQHDGFLMAPHTPYNYRFPDNWTHIELWAREYCNGNYTCATGSCGMSVKCDGSKPPGPVTTVEIWPTTSSPLLSEKYQVNVTKGFNLRVRLQPALFTYPTQYNPPVPLWPEIGCKSNMTTTTTCPPELYYSVGGDIHGCQNPCLAFQTPEFCCTGPYASPTACLSTTYQQVYANTFGESCPTANYSPFDNKIFSTGPLIKPVYNITFCDI